MQNTLLHAEWHARLQLKTGPALAAHTHTPTHAHMPPFHGYAHNPCLSPQSVHSAPDQGGGAVWLQLKEVAVGPHIGRLAAHVDGHVAHQANAPRVGIRLQQGGQGAEGQIVAQEQNGKQSSSSSSSGSSSGGSSSSSSSNAQPTL